IQQHKSPDRRAAALSPEIIDTAVNIIQDRRLGNSILQLVASANFQTAFEGADHSYNIGGASAAHSDMPAANNAYDAAAKLYANFAFGRVVALVSPNQSVPQQADFSLAKAFKGVADATVEIAGLTGDKTLYSRAATFAAAAAYY